MLDFFSSYDNMNTVNQSSKSIVNPSTERDSNESQVVLDRLDSLEQKLTNILSVHNDSADDSGKGDNNDNQSDL